MTSNKGEPKSEHEELMDFLTIQNEQKELQDITNALGIVEIDPNRNYWLVRTQAGEYFDEFYFDEFIAIGWDDIDSSLVKIGDLDKIKEQVSRKYPSESRPGHVAGVLSRFVIQMKKGDIVIIPSKESQYVAFGEILDDETYTADVDPLSLDEIDSKCPFIKRRKVKWLKHIPREKLDLYIHKLLNAHNTIVNANDYAPYIDRSLYRRYKKGDNIHIVFEVKENKKISAVDIMEFLNHILSTVDVFNNMTGTDFKKEDLDLRINVQSPGPAEFIGIAAGVGLVVSAVAIFLFGGGLDFEYTQETLKAGVKTKGMLGRILEFKKQTNEQNIEIMKLKAQIEESRTKLQIAPPNEE